MGEHTSCIKSQFGVSSCSAASSVLTAVTGRCRPVIGVSDVKGCIVLFRTTVLKKREKSFSFSYEEYVKNKNVNVHLEDNSSPLSFAKFDFTLPE